MTYDYDVVVIGGGHNGLIGAAYLAQAGLRPVVIEKNSEAGGFLVTLPAPNHEGFTLEIGALDFNMFGASGIYDELNLADYGLTMLERDPLYMCPSLDGSALYLYRDVARTCAAIAEEFSPKEAENYGAFVGFVGRMFGAIAGTGDPAPRMERLLAHAAEQGMSDQVMRLLTGSAYGVFDTWLNDERLKAGLAWYAAHNQISPAMPGSGFGALWLAGEHFVGSVRPQGGSRAFVGALTRQIEQHGGAVLTGTSVKRVLLREGQAHGVRLTDGREITSRAVLSSIDALRLFRQLCEPEDVPPELHSELRAVHSGSSNVGEFTIACALNEKPDWSTYRRGAEFEVAGQYVGQDRATLTAFFADMAVGRIPQHPPLMISTPTLLDPTLAPAGKHTLWLCTFMPFNLAGDADWNDYTAQVTEAVLAEAGRYAPNIPGAVLDAAIMNPVQWEQLTGAPFGNPNHIDASLDQMFGYRPTPLLSGYRTPLKGLYLTGSGTAPGGGINGVPGRNAAQTLLTDLG
jgi:beta-carotene ketolase (CrtO type)